MILSFEHPDLIDAKFTSRRNRLHDSVKNIIGENETITAKYMTPSEQIRQYKYILAPDGYATAWKRVPWILSSSSVLIKPHSRFIQWFYDKMVPNKHFILIKNDLSDLIPKLKWLRSNDNKSLELIKNANEFAEKYLSPEAIKTFTLNLLLKFAKIQQLNLT